MARLRSWWAVPPACLLQGGGLLLQSRCCGSGRILTAPAVRLPPPPRGRLLEDGGGLRRLGWLSRCRPRSACRSWVPNSRGGLLTAAALPMVWAPRRSGEELRPARSRANHFLVGIRCWGRRADPRGLRVAVQTALSRLTSSQPRRPTSGSPGQARTTVPDTAGTLLHASVSSAPAAGWQLRVRARFGSEPVPISPSTFHLHLDRAWDQRQRTPSPAAGRKEHSDARGPPVARDNLSCCSRCRTAGEPATVYVSIDGLQQATTNWPAFAFKGIPAAARSSAGVAILPQVRKHALILDRETRVASS